MSESPRRTIVETWIVVALAEACLLAWCFAGCGDQGGTTSSAPTSDSGIAAEAMTTNLPKAFTDEHADLRACALANGIDIGPNPAPVSYEPMVRCADGAHCCVSAHRGGEEGSGTVFLPEPCLIDGAASWLAFEYRHEDLHAHLPGEDPCHSSPLWRECVDSNQLAQCTAALRREGSSPERTD